MMDANNSWLRRACRWFTGLELLVAGVLTASAVAIVGGSSSPAFADDPIDYQQQIAPLLQKYCAGCHNDADMEGDFSVSSLDTLRKGTPEGQVLAAGKPESSKLMQVLLSAGEDKMPPEGEPQPGAQEIQILSDWIQQGAKGESVSMGLLAKLNVPKLRAAPRESQYLSAACQVSDGRIAFGRLGSVELRDMSADSSLWTNDELPGKINAIRRSPDGMTLVVSGGIAGVGGEVTLLDAQTGAVKQRFQAHNDTVYCASLSPDGKWLASGSYDRNVILWDVASGAQSKQFGGHNGAIYDLDFDPSSRALVTASADQTVKLWNVQTGQRLDTFGQPEGEMRCVRFSQDGSAVFAAGADRQIRKWHIFSLDKPAINPMLMARFAHEADVLQLHVVDDGRLVSASRDLTVKLWDIDRLEPLGEIGILSEVPVAICVADFLNEPSESGAIGLSVIELTGKIRSLHVDTLKKIAANKSATIEATLNDSGAHSDLPNDSASTVAVDSTATQDPMRASQAATSYEEVEPNDSAQYAMDIELPAEITGTLVSMQEPEDADLYRFHTQAGQQWIFEARAAEGSPLDSRIEVLDAEGNAVVQTRLQAVRESYFTFRGKDSDTIDDFRMHKWEDMELDEYLYANGEVVKLWLYPRGPDSGFKVYPGAGKRNTFFDTTPLAHALGETTYIVRELQSGEEPLPNGLPVFPMYYENDDDSQRQMGRDSRLTFTAPADGDYLLRVRDARGFGGADFKYRVVARAPAPDFTLAVQAQKMDLTLGTGREWSVTATRLDGLDGPISIELGELPEGLIATNPLIIEAGQITATGTIYASPSAAALLANTALSAADSNAVPAAEAPAAPSTGDKAGDADTQQPMATEPTIFEIPLRATSQVAGRTITHELPNPLQVSVLPAGGIRMQVVDAEDAAREVDELIIRPGQTISAKIVLDRADQQGAISFGNEDSGRGLPHGAYIDNIGLNGLLIPAGQNEREFFITAARKLQPGRYQFHLRIASSGNPTTQPIWLRVLP